MLLRHKRRAIHDTPQDFVFAAKTGRPLQQRNVLRALRAAQRQARAPSGEPTFPALHVDGSARPGAAPTFHGFRHTAASHAIAAGDSAEEISWMLGHKDSTVTRQVYIQEVQSTERRARIRSRMERRYASVLS
jgi:integrase